MKKIAVFSILLIVGLVLSQTLPSIQNINYEALAHVVKVLTMIALAFIMIHVGYEFDIDKSRLGEYGWDYIVAATAATFPWIFVAAYFVWFLIDPATSTSPWKEALLSARFAAPTSAGVLFSMLVAAGLGATWMYRKTRILAIFDDLDTVLLMIPLKMLIVGMVWQLGAMLVPMLLLVWVAWHYLHRVKIPITWPWVLTYSTIIAFACEGVYFLSKLVDEVIPIHIEVLLPAFVLGCIIARQGDPDSEPQDSSAHTHHDDVLEQPNEKRMATLVSAVFMVLVGLSMPAIIGVAGSPEDVARVDREIAEAYLIEDGTAGELVPAPEEDIVLSNAGMGWGTIILHVLIVTFLSNIGKMFPLFCYREEAHWKERLAVAVAMFPRGEVGAGILVISMSYGIGGPVITVAMLSLALNLLCTGVFILIVRKLLGDLEMERGARPSES